MNSSANRLAVLGGGTMGVGIAALAAGHGLDVIVVEIDDERRAKVGGLVAREVRLGQLLGRLDRDATTGPVTVTADLADVVGHAPGVVVEAVTERPDLKKKLLGDVSAGLGEDVVIVSNTSAIPIDELAASVSRPENVVGVHFMNPPYLIEAVEVIRGPRSSDAAMTTVLSVLEAMSRTPIVVGDGPGFVINRILQRAINEAARIVEDGVASPADVDRAFVGCLGHTTGPLATADLIGLDNVVDSLEVLLERTGDAGYRPCDLLRAKVADGHHGRKTGRGFFEYGV